MSISPAKATKMTPEEVELADKIEASIDVTLEREGAKNVLPINVYLSDIGNRLGEYDHASERVRLEIQRRFEKAGWSVSLRTDPIGVRFFSFTT